MKMRIVLFAIFVIIASTTLSFSQESATLMGADVVKAGEDIGFTLSLDKAPNFEPGRLQFYIVSLDNPAISLGWSIPTKQDVRRYTTSIRIPMDAPEGRWGVTVTFNGGFKDTPVNIGKVVFRVIGIKGLVIPSSAELTVNLSQTQLLRTQLIHLQERIQNLKSELVKAESTDNKIQSALSASIKDSIEDLVSTEKHFQELATVPAQSDVSQAFFNDLKLSYKEALFQIEKYKPSARSVSRLTVSYSTQNSTSPKYPMIALPALRALEQNELAYNLVTEKGSLAFDLEVRTIPAGAVVSYKRRGDNYRLHPDATNSVIKSLPYAIWIIQFQKPGYKVEEREHDPFREANHVISVELTK